jgi:hypothetical protein
MGWRTWFRPNAVRVTRTEFGVDDYALAVQSALTRLTHPASPQCQGTQTRFGISDVGDPFNGNSFQGVTPPAQSFHGAAVNIQFSGGAYGDPAGLPGTSQANIDTDTLIADAAAMGIML